MARATVRVANGMTTFATGVALTPHIVIEVHCPGVNGNRQPSCWSEPLQSAGFDETSGGGATPRTDAAETIPAMSRIALAFMPACALS